MNMTTRVLLGCALLAASAAFAAPPGQCERDPRARGLPERMHSMSNEMDRIEWTLDRAEQRLLLDLHAKKMQEGLRELRQRKAGEACRLEMMHAMMEQMLRHQLAASETTR